jgi:hypothetical protein
MNFKFIILTLKLEVLFLFKKFGVFTLHFIVDSLRLYGVLLTVVLCAYGMSKEAVWQ